MYRKVLTKTDGANLPQCYGSWSRKDYKYDDSTGKVFFQSAIRAGKYERSIQMKKKLIVILAVVLVFAFATTAFASNQDFWMDITSGGESDRSYATYKSDGENAWYVTPKSTCASYPGKVSNWVSGETVRFRARFSSNLNAASSLYSRTTPNYGSTFSYPYLDSTPQYSIYYRLYCDKPSWDTYGDCTLLGTWCP